MTQKQIVRTWLGKSKHLPSILQHWQIIFFIETAFRCTLVRYFVVHYIGNPVTHLKG